MFTNWKTTLIGVGLGFLNVWASGISAKQTAISIGLAALGAVAKDFNTTGGTVPATPEAVDRVKK